MKMNLTIGNRTRAKLHKLLDEALNDMVAENTLRGEAHDLLKPLENAGLPVEEVAVDLNVLLTMYSNGKRISKEQWELGAMERQVLGQ
jgi:hypothetical protein